MHPSVYSLEAQLTDPS